MPKTSRQRRRRWSQCAAGPERLEARCLLSAALAGGVWHVAGDDARGTRGADAIVVEPTAADAAVLRATVNGVEVGTVALAGLSGVEVDGGRGNDRVSVRLGDAANPAITVRVLGGAGDDVLTGSAAAEQFFGGRGNDLIDGAGGNDVLGGDAGGDELLGGDGDDAIRGGGGNDLLAGGWGADDLAGERGADRLDGGSDADHLDGGAGADRVTGGAGADTLRGGKGADQLFHEDGVDSLGGGAPGTPAVKPDRKDQVADDADARRPVATREHDDAELRKWLVDTAVRQWAWAFDRLVGGWGYGFGRGGELFVVDAATGGNVGTGGGSGVPAPVPPAVPVGLPATDNNGGTEGRGDTGGTNVQEVGVDEADLVETDGQHVYTLQNGELVIVRAAPADAMTVASRTPIAGDPIGIFRHGANRVTVLTGSHNWTVLPVLLVTGGLVTGRPLFAPPGEPARSEVRVTVLDVSDPAAPRTVEETVLDGVYGGARLVNERLYVVLDNNTWVPSPQPVPRPNPDPVPDPDPVPPPEPTPDPDPTPPPTPQPTPIPGPPPDPVPPTEPSPTSPDFVGGGSGDVYESEASYRARLEAMPLADLLPGYRTTSARDGAGSGLLVNATDTYVRDATSPELGQNLTTVALLDVADDAGGPGASSTTAGFGGVVYASADALYLASLAWNITGEATRLFEFGLGADAVPLVATGEVSGGVLNQFSMDAEGDTFRIATTGWSGDSGTGPVVQSSSVHVLEQAGDDLEVIGSVTGLAPGERMRSARFVGDRAYVVTFLQIDPLFTIDLADPRNPRVAGELKIPGFSSYLHPVGEDLLIGLGRDVDETGRDDRGLQLSLFDVSDAGNPRRVATYKLSESFGQTEAAFDHHAFAYFAEQGILALPVTRFEGDAQRHRLVVLRVDPTRGGDAFERLGEVVTAEQVRRNLRIGDVLYSVSAAEIQARDLDAPETLLGSVGTGPA